MKKIVAFIMAVAMSLALVACGGESASDMEAIKAKGEMVIGYTVYEPMNYTDENGIFTGFDTELAIAVCKKLGVTPKFVEINWDTKEVELNAGSIDCVWNGMTITEERQANMEITNPYVVNAQVVVMLADKEYNNTTDLAGKNVCAEQGSAGQSTIEADEGLKQANYIPKTVQTDCLMEVAAGTCDAAVLDITLANAMIGEGTDYANLAIKDQLAEEFYGVAFRKGSDAAAATNAAFEALIADGTMAALAEKYSLTLAE
ncbi:MAG: transporter substrate-binding domain-containing protein [Ruminococcaceae bacterium]|nr:transporter substrate-binding domain-containing protein [Oscillospiraceae bacterium]